MTGGVFINWNAINVNMSHLRNRNLRPPLRYGFINMYRGVYEEYFIPILCLASIFIVNWVQCHCLRSVFGNSTFFINYLSYFAVNHALVSIINIFLILFFLFWINFLISQLLGIRFRFIIAIGTIRSPINNDIKGHKYLFKEFIPSWKVPLF